MSLIIDGKLVLTGFVGDDYWDDGFTSKQVLIALAEIGRENEVCVLLNSGGGYVHEGAAIYNALMSHKGKVTIEVAGIAASAASVIAMAGEEIIMKAGATMMIHDPSSATWGDADDHTKSAEMLDKLGDQIASIYADRTGDDVASLRQEMKAELWLTGEEAVERGFATSVAEKDSNRTEPTAFDYRIYACASDDLKRLAANRNWALSPDQQAVASANASATQQKEKSVGGKKKADDETAENNVSTKGAGEAVQVDPVKAATNRIQSILNCDEAIGRQELASQLAFETDLSVEQAVACLEKSAASAGDEPPVNYEATRMSANVLVEKPGASNKPKNSLKPADIYAMRRQQNGSA